MPYNCFGYYVHWCEMSCDLCKANSILHQYIAIILQSFSNININIFSKCNINYCNYCNILHIAILLQYQYIGLQACLQQPLIIRSGLLPAPPAGEEEVEEAEKY